MPRHRLLGFVVLLFWGIMMLLFVRQRAAESPVAWNSPRDRPPAESWLGLFVARDSEPIGYVHLVEETVRRDGTPGRGLSLDAELALTLLGEESSLTITGSTWRAFDTPVAAFEFTLHSAGQGVAVRGSVADGMLRATVESGGLHHPIELPVDGELLLASGLAGALELPALEPGDELFVTSFDPTTLSAGETRLRCTGIETIVAAGRQRRARVVEVSSGGLDSRVWIGDRGEVLAAETPFGLTLRQVTPRVASSIGRGSADLLQETAVAARGIPPRRGATAMRFRVLGEPDLAELPEDETQSRTTVADGATSYLVVTPDLATLGPPTDPGPEFLAADPFVQSDHGEIRELAATIVGEETDRWEQTRRVHRWVYETLDKRPVLSIPSALEVLHAGAGDCNEHTVLFTALARAVGIPTRIAIGLVWSESLEGFYYHAWPEVHLDRWLWIDPTLGQEIADATHVKLLNGGLAQWPRLMAWMGRIELEVEEVR